MPFLQSKLLEKDMTARIVHAMQEGLLIFNHREEIQAINTAALEILKLRNEADLLGKKIDNLFLANGDVRILLGLLAIEKQFSQREAVLMRSTGDKIFCLLSGSVLGDGNGEDSLKVLIFQDITERKMAELEVVKYSEKLEKMIGELDQFAYIVSHDLKAPLRAITNLAQWLYEDIRDAIGPENQKSLELLKSRALRMEALIDGILEYSKIGRVKVNSELVDLKTLIMEIADLLVGASSKDVEISFSSPMPVLKTSRTLLHQVFANLISNAIKYNDKPKVMIDIGAVEFREFYQFHVHDNGPGIPEEFHQKVFVIFQTLQARDKVESTGIGLTIVKRIVEERGGAIWIESTAETGAKMIFTWSKTNPANHGE